jgi:hypothetical protein
MRKIALLALALTCVSAPAFSQDEDGAVPNPVNPGGTTPTQTAPSITGGVPNPVSPLGVDPRTQLPLNSSGQTTAQHRTECLTQADGSTICQ